jgi:hypothetical protein
VLVHERCRTNLWRKKFNLVVAQVQANQCFQATNGWRNLGDASNNRKEEGIQRSNTSGSVNPVH